MSFTAIKIKARKGKGGIAPGILNLGNRGKRVVNYTLRPFYPRRKLPRCPLERRRSHFLKTIVPETNPFYSQR
jgi:hypothetical protein